MKKQEPVTHIVKSFDGGNNLRYTRHTSLADAQKEKRHRITEAFHRYVMILTVEEIHITLNKAGGPVTGWREVIPDKAPAKRPAQHRQAVR